MKENVINILIINRNVIYFVKIKNNQVQLIFDIFKILKYYYDEYADPNTNYMNFEKFAKFCFDF